MTRRRGLGRRLLQVLAPLGVLAAAIGMALGLAALWAALAMAGILPVDPS